jgi:hypothetical protein
MGKGDEFEKVVEEICLQLSIKERMNAEIKTKVKIQGDDGTTHEIDVLYIFEQFGIKYRVGIECKNWKQPINVSELRNFDYKLNHIGGINGIFISAESDFQSGARKVSEFNGIRLVKYDDFNKFANSDFFRYLTPDISTVGNPFWMLIDTKGEKSIEQNSVYKDRINLFLSKKLADEEKNNKFSDCDNIIVVGVSQEHLKEIKKLKIHYRIQVYKINHTLNYQELSEADLNLYIH